MELLEATKFVLLPEDQCQKKYIKAIHWKILEKDVVDEMIFRTENPRNRLMLKLMAPWWHESE